MYLLTLVASQSFSFFTYKNHYLEVVAIVPTVELETNILWIIVFSSKL